MKTGKCHYHMKPRKCRYHMKPQRNRKVALLLCRKDHCDLKKHSIGKSLHFENAAPSEEISSSLQQLEQFRQNQNGYTAIK